MPLACFLECWARPTLCCGANAKLMTQWRPMDGQIKPHAVFLACGIDILLTKFAVVCHCFGPTKLPFSTKKKIPLKKMQRKAVQKRAACSCKVLAKKAKILFKIVRKHCFFSLRFWQRLIFRQMLVSCTIDSSRVFLLFFTAEQENDENNNKDKNNYNHENNNLKENYIQWHKHIHNYNHNNAVNDNEKYRLDIIILTRITMRMMILGGG